MGAFPLKINCDRQYSVKKKERKKLVTKEEEEGRSRQVKRFKIPHHFIESGFVGFILFIDIECLCYCFNLPVSDEEQNEQIEPFNFSKTVFFLFFFSSFLQISSEGCASWVWVYGETAFDYAFLSVDTSLCT